MIRSGEVVVDDATYTAQVGGRAARPDVQGVRAAQVPRPAPRPGLHPRAAAAGGLGLRLLRRHPHRRRPRPAAARQARPRARDADRHRAQRRLPLRAAAPREDASPCRARPAPTTRTGRAGPAASGRRMSERRPVAVSVTRLSTHAPGGRRGAPRQRSRGPAHVRRRRARAARAGWFGCHASVVSSGSTLVGYAQVDPAGPSVELVVHPDHRGAGRPQPSPAGASRARPTREGGRTATLPGAVALAERWGCASRAGCW